MRRLVLLATVTLALVGAAALLYVLRVEHRGRDVHGSATVEFEPPRTDSVRREAPSASSARAALRWPTYGFDAARRRSLPHVSLRPPYRRLWTWHGRALLEFPPAVADGRIFMPTFDGRFYALDARTGRAEWRYTSHRCGWASPAIGGALVVQTFIGRVCNASTPGGDGEVVAFDRHSGRIRWRRTIGPTESSPLVAGGSVYVGDWSGRVYAFAVQTGETRWRFSADATIKGSPALAGGRLYIGSYGGRLYALDARDGHELWSASAQPRLGRRGAFYSTPAVAYGRVYLGSTDGKVYSFGAESGALRWSHSTGGYVYASPAVWRGLVLIGSYDHTFYALDAATGATRWAFRADGPISGSATVLGGVVYFSTFATSTYALDAATGRRLWRWPDGKYSPVVTDGRRIYLTGLGRLYALAPDR